jgi:hypothetical protein
MWSLSPIGGQGALRALSLGENAMSHEYPIMSYPKNNLSAFEGGPFNSGASGGASLINQFRAPIGAVFSTQDIALLHSSNASQAFESTVQRLGGMQEAIKSTQRDLWRNVRIPFLHTLDGARDRMASITKRGNTRILFVDRSANTRLSVGTKWQHIICREDKLPGT